MKFIFSHETKMFDIIIPIMVLVIGFIVALSIFKNRFGAFYKTNLLTKSIPAKFPFSKMLEIKLGSMEIPERIFVSFKRSIGLYNGKIIIVNGDREVGSYLLPQRQEFSNERLHFFNEDILRQSNMLTIPVAAYNKSFPLKVMFQLNLNVHNSEFKRQMKFIDEDQIELSVKGTLVEERVKGTS